MKVTTTLTAAYQTGIHSDILIRKYNTFGAIY